ncbi:class C sortase [Bombiscardovia nodaiensis]|uniref:Class C sortase n=1 Tax=Bombiscardovia nodaiensis TaxID=2932181 RepID=A0ABN6SCZ8_9BIFI|nr:class C sortase [Bombiscardovia nodaiensis]
MARCEAALSSYKRLFSPSSEQESGRKPHRGKVDWALRVAIGLCLLVAAVALLWIPATQLSHMVAERATVNRANQKVADWPQGKVARELARAQAYNRAIAAGDQSTLGEAADPFVPASAPAARRTSLASRDQSYQRALNADNGLMGSVRIPKISLNMPIYHGTSDRSLSQGAGHLYGTSLPVGGPSTNAVLTGHRGLPGALLFTRLDELTTGDVFYVNTLGRTMGYRIVSIHVVNPDDTHLYTVVQGEDLVTLMTCTPYGVNTQRLVITGQRAPIPRSIPEPEHAPKDALLIAFVVGFGVLVLGCLLYMCSPRGTQLVRHRRA